METENSRAGDDEQADTGNDSRADIATGSDVGGVDSTGGSADPDSAVSGVSRQARRKPDENDGRSGTDNRKTRTRANTNPTGSKSRAKKGTKSGLDLNAEARAQLAKQVAGVHQLIGIAIGQPQLVAISDDQAVSLTNAAMDVMQHYDMSISPVAVAWANLAAVCATIYAPKFLMFNAMRKQAQQYHQPKPQTENDIQPNVFDFSVGGGG